MSRPTKRSFQRNNLLDLLLYAQVTFLDDDDVMMPIPITGLLKSQKYQNKIVQDLILGTFTQQKQAITHPFWTEESRRKIRWTRPRQYILRSFRAVDKRFFFLNLVHVKGGFTSKSFAVWYS